MDGDLVAVIGLVNDGPMTRFFSEYRDELEPYMKTMPVLRVIKKVMAMIENHLGVVYSHARDDEGARVLTRLGFDQLDGDLFIWRH